MVVSFGLFQSTVLLRAMSGYVESYLLSVVAEPARPGLLASSVRSLLRALSALYDVGLDAYLTAEKVGMRRRKMLPVPVISIGNLTVGGTGKTPMTQMLCRRLQAHGTRLAVLSRGHGGESQSVRLVSDRDGPCLLTASEAGDEPVLLAQSLPGVPVLVGKDRRLSGREALRRFDLDALVLDDGFQYWQLARTLDIVLLDARRPFGNGHSLPRGLLRESKRHLSRAGIVVVTRASQLNGEERLSLTAQIAALAPSASLYFADHHATGFVSVSDLAASLLPLDALRGKAIYAVSAIAQPASFLHSLEQEAEVRIAGQEAWDDHHAFDLTQAREVQKAALLTGAVAIVMTEKDAVKWPTSVVDSLPTYALRVEMAIENEAEFLAEILGRIKRD
jgi:tetraacyldisaccharide 4'-kinase